MEKKPKGKYQDIINLPHHVSKTHPQMPLYDRAAQFSPFAALTGYEDAIRETARLTDNWVQLSEDKKQELDEKLRSVCMKNSLWTRRNPGDSSQFELSPCWVSEALQPTIPFHFVIFVSHMLTEVLARIILML